MKLLNKILYIAMLFDYLQIDLEANNGSTLSTLEKLEPIERTY